MNAEEVKVGGYQVLTLLLLSVNFIIVAMSHALTLFYKYTPKFFCQESASADTTTTTSMLLRVRNRTYGCASGCPIGHYAFQPLRPDERSVAMEWQLVCEREHLLKLGGDVYLVGLLVGAVLAGVLADRVGRLPVLAMCLYAQGTMAVALNVVQDYQLFVIFRALQGVFMQGLESCTYILCLELFPARYRTLTALIVLSMRSLGLAILSGLSYGIPDWRYLQLVVSVPTAVTVLYIWLIPESPRWLLARGKSMEAELLLERIAKYNGLCSLFTRSSRCHDEDPENATTTTKPTKPKRKTRADGTTDVEKSSPEESKNLLSSNGATQEKPTTETTTNGNSSEEKRKSGKLPSDLDIEEIAKASLMVVESDEKNPVNEKGGGTNNGPSYLLVSKEALATGDSEDSAGRRGLMGFLDARFIGRNCAIMMFLWFTSSLAFHALVTLPHRPSTDRHVSLSLSAVMEVGAFLLVYLLVLSRCGRRWPLCLAQLIVGTACITYGVLAIVALPIDWIAPLRTSIANVGRVANIASFFILRLVVIELFPTISRGTGVGLCVGAEMIGGLLTPYVLAMDVVLPRLSRLVVGCLCILGALLSLLFPETGRVVLPDTVADAKSLGQKPGVLREKLFSEDWVDAGNGIIVDFTENNDKNNKNNEQQHPNHD